MAKQRPSLEAFAQSGKAAPAVTEPAKIIELHTTTEKPQAAAPRKDRPHTTLYLDKRVQRVIKEIALQYDCKAHDLYLEGINLMLAHYGRPSVEDLSK